jgi:hypothetical protein
MGRSQSTATIFMINFMFKQAVCKQSNGGGCFGAGWTCHAALHEA